MLIPMLAPKHYSSLKMAQSDNEESPLSQYLAAFDQPDANKHEANSWLNPEHIANLDHNYGIPHRKWFLTEDEIKRCEKLSRGSLEIENEDIEIYLKYDRKFHSPNLFESKLCVIL